MAKSILQNIATLNAKLFNDAQSQNALQNMQTTLDLYYKNNSQLLHDSENKYKVLITQLFKETTINNNIIKSSVEQLDMNIKAFQDFTISEIAKYYFNIGSVKKAFQRKDQKILDDIDKLKLQKLEHFTGPVSTPILDSTSGFLSGYNTPIPLTNRDWVYIQGAKLMYKEYSFIDLETKVNSKNTVTIGDVTRFNNIFCPGTVIIENDTTINKGKLKITSKNITDNSITTNGNIISSGGYLKSNLGVQVTKGGVKIKTGDVYTLAGDIKTDSGKLLIGRGSLKNKDGVTVSASSVPTNTAGIQGYTYSNLGFVSSTGGFINLGIGDIKTTQGDIKTLNGKLTCTKDISTKNGNISILEQGNFYTKNGNVTSSNGNLILNSGYANINNTARIDYSGIKLAAGLSIDVKDGNLHITEGDIILDNGSITSTSTASGGGHIINGGKLYIADGDIEVKQGNLLLDEGNLTVTGLGTISKNLTVGGNLTVNGKSYLNDDTNIDGRLVLTGDISCDRLSTGTGNFTGDVISYGDFWANGGNGTFYGKATSAEYADLAEKYQSDKYYEPGTVLSIGTETEVTLFDSELPYAGVVSTNPAFIMNNTLTENSVEVVLKGRVSVKTLSDNITRGMYITPDTDNAGYCIGLSKQDFKKQDLELIGICITPSKNGLVEVKI